ncbi:MAG: hypothetical protein FJW96_06700 [Actinobacteria bacterium]|nr:hypothetical protein [Actinomycetota bacterium]
MDALTAPITNIPAHVRADGADGRRLWEAALGFESFLVRAMAASLAGGAEGTDDAASDSASSTMRGELPDALANAVAGSGGLGLADQLYAELRRQVSR